MITSDNIENLREIHELRQQVEELEAQLMREKELREGDNILIRALAEGAGIKITCNPKMLGLVWEQFHDGVIEMKRKIDNNL